MLRLAVIEMMRRGVRVCCPVHNALLIEADRQIAQLTFDFVWNELAILSGELLLVEQATKRLYRSKEQECADGGLVSVQMTDFLCATCGSEMLPHVGIDEPDFWQCTLLRAVGRLWCVTE